MFDASSTLLDSSPRPPSPSLESSTRLSRDEGHNYRTPPSQAPQYFKVNYSSYSSDEASEDGDDVPPTPGDFDSFRSISILSSRNGDGMSKLPKIREGNHAAGLEGDDSLSLSPVASSFYPSFGDFLPSVKTRQQAIERNGLGLGDLTESHEEVTTLDKIELLSQQLARKFDLDDEKTVEARPVVEGEPRQALSPITGASVFAPFATFSPNTDSFTFFPSPEWKANEQGSRNGKKEEEEPVASSAALRSPEPELGVAAFPMRKSLSASHVIVTPPSTPVRNANYRTQAPSMQQSRSLPVPVSLSPSRSPFTAPSPSPTRSSFSQSAQPLSPHRYGGTPPGVYPLSPHDTERIAKLHNGRIPTLEQLCPEPVHPSAQPPIVNTGNQGVMVVQQGDWKCGTCSFVNWRRRKICLRCFPFANDIGNILTIQSQRAANLATPMSAPAHQTNFLIPDPTRGQFDFSPSATGYPSARSRQTQPYLLVPPPQMPHSASPTRSTFNLHAPPSPTRYLSPSPSPSSAYQSQYHSSSEGERFYSTPSSSLSSLNAISAGDLAIRRASKLQQIAASSSSNGARKYPSIQPLNLSNYSQQCQYAAQAQTSPTYERRDYEQYHRESPPSPTRYLNQQARQNVMIGAEL
ncbi:zinc finger Ran-binding domain-containing protein [Sporobolomyces salmoneus]|uniref:zinc finger Ran-binding domain-containing protein n=1 Tax=Sporobolomyces salmoneus TaxID=183962 RepID=UPI00317A9A0C